ncbi:CAP domain-containing protein [Strongyloides ratti]|uniref:CAP domain-containing protein n=1 Tax=Strongyloides ratti TaxID=34506 RepID=A0A090LQP9_STRRB|nr:CAP domain-containing protein [Strongyloides ratti]CEF69906.1 CAP domain-containing protein [Strongyloides ratti]
MKLIIFINILFIVLSNLVTSIKFAKLKLQFYHQHNCYRRNNKVGPLKVSKRWAFSAQKYANKLARQKNGLHHSNSNGRYGENIYWFSTKKGAGKAVKLWYSEVKHHNYSSNKMNGATGHFTQIVWKSTKYVGCGVAASKGNGVFVVCQYYPPGNYDNKFLKNVFRHKTLKPKC